MVRTRPNKTKMISNKITHMWSILLRGMKWHGRRAANGKISYLCSKMTNENYTTLALRAHATHKSGIHDAHHPARLHG